MGSSSQSVVLISDKTSGGAAIACSRLLRGLRSVSKREFLWLAGEGTARAEVKCLSEWRGAMEIFVERLITRAFSGNKQSMDRLNRRLAVYCNERRMAKTIRKMSPGLINLHNIHDAMRFSMVETLPRDTSIVWTLHDMWPLTGYCCYSFDCRKYREGCRGECPQLNKWGDLFSTPSEEWSRRQRFYQQNRNRIVFVTPSQWLAGCARNRFDGTIRVECIPNSLDTNVFKPVGSKKEMREALELPTDKRIVLAGSRYPNDPRKGTEYLVEATERLRESLGDSFAVVVFGEYSAEDLPNDWIRSRSISDEKLLNLYYNAADVFVVPSIADNLPNTLLEATSAGTPCVTFDVGGCPEVVRAGETGFVAGYKNAEDLAGCIERVLTMPEEQAKEMSKTCRQRAEREYALKVQAERYLELFQELSEDR